MQVMETSDHSLRRRGKRARHVVKPSGRDPREVDLKALELRVKNTLNE